MFYRNSKMVHVLESMCLLAEALDMYVFFPFGWDFYCACVCGVWSGGHVGVQVLGCNLRLEC